MISLAVAIGLNNVIGYKNDLPWHYKEDLKYFKELTTGKTVVMGRKTFDSILNRNGKILPNRHNVVVTRDTTFKYDNVEVVNNFDKYLKSKLNVEEEIFIIGGSEIFKSSLNDADRLYITWVNKEYPGDTFFPEVDFKQYKLIKEEVVGELNFSVYERLIK